MTGTAPNGRPVPARHVAIARQLATCGGIGRLPWAPGTWGSAFAVAVAAGLVWVGGQAGVPGAWVLSTATILAFLVGVWAGGRHAVAIGRDDPGEVVIDEVAGQWLTLLPVALDYQLYPIAFLAFRLFDITKPWPARPAERLHGGVGIMADDIVAGVYAGVVTWLAALWLT